MKITAYLHGSKESFRDAGEKAGLKGEALAMFAHAGCEHKVVYDVDENTGEATAVSIDDRIVERP